MLIAVEKIEAIIRAVAAEEGFTSTGVPYESTWGPKIVERCKQAAIPGGQVAEDERAIRSVFDHACAERCARLSAAGRVLSERVDRTAGGTVGHVHGCPCAECVRAYPDAEGARKEMAEYMGKVRAVSPEPYKTTVGHKATGPELLWTMRDEFAKAAMQGLIVAGGAVLERPGIARAAYMMADSMMKVREAK